MVISEVYLYVIKKNGWKTPNMRVMYQGNAKCSTKFHLLVNTKNCFKVIDAKLHGLKMRHLTIRHLQRRDIVFL